MFRHWDRKSFPNNDYNNIPTDPASKLSVPATLALRSVSVGIADMVAFQIGAETADTVKSKKCCKFTLLREN